MLKDKILQKIKEAENAGEVIRAWHLRLLLDGLLANTQEDVEDLFDKN